MHLHVLAFAILGAQTALAPAAGAAPSAIPSTQEAASADALSPDQFKSPSMEYRPIDCWWWDGGELSEERLTWQLEDMKAKGVGGTWLYPRFGAAQPLSSEPGFWTDGWWRFVDHALSEHERLGMQQWSNDWLGRLSKNHFQEQLSLMRSTHPGMTGRRLVLHRSREAAKGALEVEIPRNQTVVSAAAYRMVPGSKDTHDHTSRIELRPSVTDNRLIWTPPASERWTVAVVATEPFGLDYLAPEVAERWIDIFFSRYEEKVGRHLGKALAAYGPDERQVLNGNIPYSEDLAALLADRHGVEFGQHLSALFLDLGPITDRVRCGYHAAVVDRLETCLYGPIRHWLHSHGMKQATIATWGRKNICGQTFNYGDFFRMMGHFDITGNEDSVESGRSAFIDTKLSSSIAHLNGSKRVAVCAYWGTGWGFTQEENIARTNVNFALGVNLLNTHGGMYSLMGSRNEFVPPAVHFYQPYWQTWRTFYDHVTRLSYVMSQGTPRADVAILYPLSTLHAQWNGDAREKRAFADPARHAERTMFEMGESIYEGGIDFDFVDERRMAVAEVSDGHLAVQRLRFSTVLLPGMTTVPLALARKLGEFVAAGGTLIAARPLATATPDRGRDDPELRQLWQSIFGGSPPEDSAVVRSAFGGGRAMLVDGDRVSIVAGLIRGGGQTDVLTPESDLIYTHNQVGAQHVYYLVNRRPERRSVALTLRAQGAPELWDSHSGYIRPVHRFELKPEGTSLRLDFEPGEGKLVVVQPRRDAPQVLADTLKDIEAVRPDGDGMIVQGTAGSAGKMAVRLIHNGRPFEGALESGETVNEVKLEGDWECEYHPTMDNRWGDFRHPASPTAIGPETPVLRYHDEIDGTASKTWALPGFDDSSWPEVTCSYGPRWQQLGPFDRGFDSASMEARIVGGAGAKPPAVELNGKPAEWVTNDYSLKYGSGRMDVHQQPADDGLGPPSDDFLVLDRLAGKPSVCYLRTRIYSAQELSTRLHFGSDQDTRLARRAWLNGNRVLSIEGGRGGTSAPVTLQSGWNQVVLRLELPPRTAEAVRTTKGIPPLPPAGHRVQTYAVFYPAEHPPAAPRHLPVLRWHGLEGGLLPDCGDGNERVGWFRFSAPPGVRKARLNVEARDVQAWVDGRPASISDGKVNFDASDARPSRVSVVALRVSFKPGRYGGAAFSDPIAFEMGRGSIAAGDWCRQGLKYYSGGLSYSRQIEVTTEQLEKRIALDLGSVNTSAEVSVNGVSAGIRLARPFTFDLSGHLKPGTNTVIVKVLNTLANHMSSQPTRYVYDGQTVSGLLGPVTLRFSPVVTIRCIPTATK